MIKDSISYISTGNDSVVSHNPVRKDPFSILPIGAEVSDTINGNSGYSARMIQNVHKDDHRHDGSPLPFSMEQTDGIFGLLLLCFLFFTHIYNGGFNILKENVSLLLSSDAGDRMYRQTTTKEFIYTYFLIFQTIALSSICVYDIFVEYNAPLNNSVHKPLVTILSFMILMVLFFIIKSVIYRSLGYVFDMRSVMEVWRKAQVRAVETLGVLCFIPTLLLIYGSYYHLQIVIFMLVLLLIIQIILFYQIILFFIREKFNFLYLIAYLCTFEILPYIFLVVGFIYLYRIDVIDILWH